MTDAKRPSNGDYAIGYGRPPKHRRFQPGRSGNPKGRPKGSKNFSTLFAEELGQPVTLSENGKRKRMPKLQALVKQLVNKALGNDAKAATLVVNLISRSEGSTEAPAESMTEASRPEDKPVIESIIRRIRMNQDASETDAAGDMREETE
jgi:Family of unknown function (DUF5681)